MEIKFLCLLFLILLNTRGSFGDDKENEIEAEGSEVSEGGGEESRDPIAHTPSGQYQGEYDTSRDGRKYSQFLGMPYARVFKRFQESTMFNETWEGVREVTTFGPSCFQRNFFNGEVVGADDCLSINVYTPNTNGSLPVLFFIHGGGYMFGEARPYGAKYLMDEDVVYASINYRLGAFGFLNAGVDTAKGNMGLKDAVLALKWVKENIAAFGGNPNKVTIFGESAGGGMVSLLMLSPLTQGLFHSGISQSGTVLNPWSFGLDPMGNANYLAEQVDCPTSNKKYMVECLAKIDPKYLISRTTTMNIFAPLKSRRQPCFFNPTVETIQEGAFLNATPYHLLTNGIIGNKVPWMVGFNSHEGLIFGADAMSGSSPLADMIRESWSRIAPNLFQYHHIAPDPCKVSSAIREFYFGSSPTFHVDNMTNLLTDRSFAYGNVQAATLYSKHVPSTFFYELKFESDQTFTDMFARLLNLKTEDTPGLKKSAHGDDLLLLFNIPDMGFGNESERTKKYSKLFVKLWASFARNGVPTPCPKWNEDEVKWVPMDPAHTRRLVIDTRLDMAESLDPELAKRMEFWADRLPNEDTAEIF